MLRYTTADEAKGAIVEAIEANGTAKGDEYDIEGIFNDAYQYIVPTDEEGNEHVDQAGFEQVVDDEGFWRLVQVHAK